MSVAGIDYSTRFVDVVLLDEDTDAATWHRFPLDGHDAFQRARSAHALLPMASFWDDVLACGIEDPRGYGAGSLYRVQGAILSTLPHWLLVQPWIPGQWRKACGLAGNAPKASVFDWVGNHGPLSGNSDWPQDACDAYAIAYATRSLIHKQEEAA